MERLAGGNVTPVTRVGDAVHRAAGPWTDTVHALLRHVRARGIGFVPEPRGRDAEGREVLAFLPGDVHGYPLPAWMWDDAVLVAAATLLRRLHDATAGFTSPGERWRLPPREPRDVICHNDFAPHNLVFRGREPWAVIDFDAAAPGPRAWDLAYTAHRMVPLTAPGNPDTPPAPDGERARRLALLCDAYGAGIAPAEVLAVAPERLDALRAFTAAHAEAGGAAELRRHAAWYAKDAEYVRSDPLPEVVSPSDTT
ncbi:MAG: hypothetical protein QOD55_1680 [Solirubrobacteraceae bacterium]|jgi:hypothetical protein|nr:hypothetical protein [Solirubrobacteraceae bacterium]